MFIAEEIGNHTKPVTNLPGVGPATGKKLDMDGYDKVDSLIIIIILHLYSINNSISSSF